MKIIGKITVDGVEYAMDEAGRWSGEDEVMASVLQSLGGSGLVVMPRGYMEFGTAIHAIREAGRKVEIIQDLPKLEPLQPGEKS